MIQYPVSFLARSGASAGIQTPWQVSGEDYELACAVPTAFEGPGKALSPEDLFAQALTNCFVATFKVYAEKSKLHFGEVQVQAELMVDLNDQKKPVMKTCTLHAKILGCENVDRVKVIAQKAFDSGFILNSVKTSVTLSLDVS